MEQVEVASSASASHRNTTGPSRSQVRRSVETAIAVRGPSGPKATYVITCSPSASTHVTRGSSTPALPSAVSQVVSGSSTTPEPFDPGRDAVGDDHPGEPDAGDVPDGDDPGQQVELAVGPAGRGRVEHALRLVRLAGSGVITVPTRSSAYGKSFRLCRRAGHPFTPLLTSVLMNWRWNTTNSTAIGTTSTTAPASRAPKGLAVELATLVR